MDTIRSDTPDMFTDHLSGVISDSFQQIPSLSILMELQYMPIHIATSTGWNTGPAEPLLHLDPDTSSLKASSHSSQYTLCYIGAGLCTDAMGCW